RLLALAHEANGAVVGDYQAVDDQPITDDADICLSEWSCGFHRNGPA
ncbi:MAG: hypothetical protein QOJ12_2805, partial [Thermoleophilales bacterium]|nr:hypothetical protein [Thermoleophilales bacterium]